MRVIVVASLVLGTGCDHHVPLDYEIDKGPDGLAVITAVRALQTNASTVGGTVVVTLGNHEAEFFADPTNSKAEAADGFATELSTDGIDLVAIASGADPRGLWLRQQPFAALVGDWFFAHAGDPHARTPMDLEVTLETAFDTDDFRAAELTGSDSLLESRGWYATATDVDADLAALQVHHIVFGHDPSALGARGAIASGDQGGLFRIDCGMSPDVDDSHGALLRIRSDGADAVADQLAADGTTSELWRGPGS